MEHIFENGKQLGKIKPSLQRGHSIGKWKMENRVENRKIWWAFGSHTKKCVNMLVTEKR